MYVLAQWLTLQLANGTLVVQLVDQVGPARFARSVKKCLSNTSKPLSFTTDAVVEISFIATLCKVSITASILPYVYITG